MRRKIFGPLGEEGKAMSEDAIYKARCRRYGITARKHEGDDSESWAVFVWGRAVFTSMNLNSVPYYKRLAIEIEMKRGRDD